jgi:hypothetical protein
LCGDGGAVVGPVALHWAGILCEKGRKLKCWRKELGHWEGGSFLGQGECASVGGRVALDLAEICVLCADVGRG